MLEWGCRDPDFDLDLHHDPGTHGRRHVERCTGHDVDHSRNHHHNDHDHHDQHNDLHNHLHFGASGTRRR